MSREVLIVGGGVAGLAAGCYAQASGYRARVLEQHTIPGGACTAWRREGYVIDGCIHWLMGCAEGAPMRQLYEEVGALDGTRLLRLTRYCDFVDEERGERLAVTADRARLVEELRRHAGDRDRAAIEGLVDAFDALRGHQLVPGRGLAAPSLTVAGEPSQRVARERSGTRRFREALARTDVPVASFAARLASPLLRWALPLGFVPEVPLWFLLVLWNQLADGELATVEGGSLRFALAMARRLAALGGTIEYGVDVARILVEGGRAIGVRTAAGETLQGDAVVAAADLRATLDQLLDGAHTSPVVAERFRRWPLFRPALVASYGVERRFVDEAPHQVIRLAAPVEVAGEPTRDVTLRLFGDDTTLAPAGASVLQARVDTDWDRWRRLGDDRARYDEEKERVGRALLERIDRRLDGAREKTRVVDVATPLTFHRYTRCHRGAYEGWLPTPEAMRLGMAKTVPGVERLLLAGQWVEPGGGIPAAIWSARQAVELLCARDGVPFRAP